MPKSNPEFGLKTWQKLDETALQHSISLQWVICIIRKQAIGRKLKYRNQRHQKRDINFRQSKS
ncbi:hypothetical protein [Wolbachia endosymbiont (group B) of Eupithecia inturbata]|uniref:hypothetical protein n=1 Tax=Wolbachia endosymbiont (group B) of Eupithecia inturbata TaxID=3139316 RepID=UPI003CCB5354